MPRHRSEKMWLRAALLAVLAGLAACQTKPKLPPGVTPTITVGPALKSEEWKAVATAADEDRLARLGLAWSEALADANKTNPADVRREGPLLRPRSGLARPEPTPGSYRCRLFQLGRKTPKSRAFESFKPFFCYVQVDAEDQLTFTKQTGSQRPSGRFWADDDTKRMIFLGTMANDPREAQLAYGTDGKRDLVGTFERIDAFRWRLVIPWPQEKSKLDVYELTPVADQPQ